MRIIKQVIVAIYLFAGISGAEAGNVEIVATGNNWVEIAVDASDYTVTSGAPFDRVDVPGWTWLHQPGTPAVPVKVAILGMPVGSRAIVSVLDAEYETIENVNLMPVPETEATLWFVREAITVYPDRCRTIGGRMTVIGNPPHRPWPPRTGMQRPKAQAETPLSRMVQSHKTQQAVKMRRHPRNREATSQRNRPNGCKLT